MKTNLRRPLLGTVLWFATILPDPAQPIGAYSVANTNGWTFYGGKSFVVGYDFTPATTIQVTSLGILDWTGSGLAAPSEIGVWDSTGALVMSAFLPAGQFNPKSAGPPGALFYLTNTPPVTLAAGSTYRIGNQMFGSNLPLVGWGGTFTPAPDITFGAGSGNNGATFAEPTGFTNNTAYIGPVFEYQVIPTISTQPQSQTVIAGSNVTFGVVAGGASSLSYQWYFHGSPLSDGGRLSGSASNVLNIVGVQTSDAGAYQVIVSSGSGSVASSNATLTVLGPPQITGQPASEVVIPGTNTFFIVTAIGTELNYQWYFNNRPLSDGGRINGSTAAILWLADVQGSDAGVYQVIVSNRLGQVTSSNATLTVRIPPQITGQPFSETVPVGTNVTFSVTAIGPSLNYQWYFNGSAISGATNAALSLANVTAANDGSYSVTVSNDTKTVSSSLASLTVVYPPPGIVAQPASLAVRAGSNASFSVTATNDLAMTYQWFFNGTNLADGDGISGSTTSTLSVASVSTNNAGNYQIIVANAFGSVTSAVATLTIALPPAILIQPPSDQTVFWTSNLLLSATAVGTDPLGYRWYFNGIPLTEGGRITGSTSNVLAIADVQTNDAGAYQLVVANDYGSATSAVAIVNVFLWQPATIISQPTNLTVILSSNAGFSVYATGTSLNYQWYFNGAPLFDSGRISGSATAALSISNVQPGDAGNYQVVVSNVLNIVTSTTASLAVLTNISQTGAYLFTGSETNITLGPGIYNIIAIGGQGGGNGGLGAEMEAQFNFTNPTTLTILVGGVGASVGGNGGGGGGGSFVVNGITPLVIAGGGGGGGPGGGGGFYAEAGGSGGGGGSGGDTIYGGGGGGGFSGSGGSGVYGSYSGSGGSSFLSGGAGGGGSFGGTGGYGGGGGGGLGGGGGGGYNGGGGGVVGGLSYTGYSGAGGSSIIDSSAVTNLVQISGVSSPDDSQNGEIIVYIPQPPIFTEQPSLTGGFASNVTFQAAVQSAPPLRFQWYFNGMPLSDNGHYVGSMETNLTIIYFQPVDIGNYMLVANNYFSSITSSVATLTITSPPAITGQPNSTTTIAATSPSFAVTAAGTGPFSYQWAFDGTNIVGATNVILTLNNVQMDQTGSYNVLVSNAYGGVTSSNAILTVVPLTVAIQPPSQSAKEGIAVTFNTMISGQGPFGYQWQFGGTNIQNATNGTLTLTDLQANQSGAYAVVVSNSFGAVTSSNAQLTVIPWPNIDPPGQTNLIGATVSFTANFGGTPPLAYQWSFSGTNLSDNGHFSGAATASLSISNIQNYDIGAYQVVVDAAGIMETSSVAYLASSAKFMGRFFRLGEPS